MTLIQTLSNTLPCPYFDNPDNKVNLKDPDNWTFPVTDLGIDGVEILHKQYGLFKDTNDDNIGRAEGTDPAQVLVIKEDVEENGVDHTQPPVFVDVDTGDLVTGDHRKQTKIQGWMFQYVRCRDAWARKRLAKALNNGRQYHQKNNIQIVLPKLEQPLEEFPHMPEYLSRYTFPLHLDRWCDRTSQVL